MGNIEYIILLLCWLVKSNDFRDIQEVRLKIILYQRKHMNYLSQGSSRIAGNIFFQKIQIGRNKCRRLPKEQVADNIQFLQAYKLCVCVLSGSFLYLVSAWDFFL